MLSQEMKDKLQELKACPKSSVLLEYKEFTLFKTVTVNGFNSNWSWAIIYPIMSDVSSRTIKIMNVICGHIFNTCLNIANCNNGDTIKLEYDLREDKKFLISELDLYYESLDVVKIDHSLAITELEAMIEDEYESDIIESIEKTISFLEEN